MSPVYLLAVYLLMHRFAVLMFWMPKVFVLIQSFARYPYRTKLVVSLLYAFGPVTLFNELIDCYLDAIAGILLYLPIVSSRFSFFAPNHSLLVIRAERLIFVR